MRLRSLLFVPADSARKFERALASGVDAIILDLEDSIAPAGKDAARAALAERFAAAPAHGPSLLVRVNSLDTGVTARDVAAAVTCPALGGILLPKANGLGDVAALADLIAPCEAAAGLAAGSIRIGVVATETPQAMFALGSYAAGHPRLAFLTWGAEDLAAEIGATSNKDDAGYWTAPYQLARSLCLYAAAAAGVPAIDTLYADFRDADGLARSCWSALRDGFAGRIAIHPDQVATINAAFTPSAEETAHARQVVAAFAAQPGAGAIGIDGKMYDLPHLKAARRLLSKANQKESHDV